MPLTRLKVFTPARRSLAAFAAVPILLAALLLMASPIAPVEASAATRTTSGYYENALARFNKLDYSGAIIQLRNVLLEDPSNLAARILLGQAHLKVGAAQAAQKQLELARKFGADEEQIIVDLAKSYLIQGKYALLLEKILPGGRSPDVEAQVLSARGSALYELIRYEDAMVAFDQAIALAPQRPRPLLGKARVLVRQGKIERAEALVEVAHRVDPESHDAWYVKGELYRVSRRLEAAVMAYGKVVASVPTHLPARIGRAIALIDHGRHAEAVPDLNYVRRVAPGDPQPYYLLYLAYNGMGEPREAQNYLRQTDQTIRNIDANFIRSHGPTLLLSGVVALALGKPVDARFYLEEYIKLSPNHSDSRRLLGGLLIEQGQAQEAVRILRPILKMDENDWQAMALLGTALTNTGHAAEATQILRQAITIMPDRPLLRTRLALSHLAGDQAEEAVKDLEESLQQNPKAVKPAMLLSLVHLRMQQYDRALAVAERMIQQTGESAIAHNLKGGAQLGNGNRTAARASFEKALALAPDYKPAQSNLARLDINEGKLEAARGRFRRMLESDPQSIPPMIALSAIAEKQGDLKQAILWLEKVGSFKRKDVASQLHLVGLYHRTNQTENALHLALRLKQQFTSNLAVLAAVGKTELRTGAVAEAIKTFRRMANMRPDSGADLLKISRLQTSANDFEGAFDTLRRAVWVAPENFEAQKDIIKLELHLGKLDSAQKRAEELRLTMPGSDIGDRLRGDVMMAAKNYPAAIADYQAGIDKTGGDSDLAVRIYLARYHAGRRAKAIEALESWVKDHPDDVTTQRTLAAGYISVGRLSLALLAHEKLLVSLPDDAKVLNNLAWLYQQTGDQRALSFARKAYSLAPNDAAVIDTLGWILVQNGEAAEGLTLLRQANARAGRQSRIRYHMAMALSDLGRLGEARKELRVIVREAEKSDPDLARQAQKKLDALAE